MYADLLIPERRVKSEPRSLVATTGFPVIDPEIALIERDLIARVRAGDQSALEEIHRTTYSSLVALACGYLNSLDAARDVVSEVFLNVWRGREEWQPRERIHSYLCGAVRNRCLNNIRAARVREKHLAAVLADGDLPALGTFGESIDVTLEKKDMLEAIWRVIEGLPENRREMMVLRWRQQLSFEEIASVMNLNVAAVHNLMSRTMKTLRKMLPASFTEDR